jgi:hypothetical protein
MKKQENADCARLLKDELQKKRDETKQKAASAETAF